MITLPADLSIGFGRAAVGATDNLLDIDLSQAPALGTSGRYEDLQRGEMNFILRDAAGALVPQRLPVEFITSASLDPASSEAMDETNEVTSRQPVAFVRIPSGLVGDNDDPLPMEITVERWRRNQGGAFEIVPQSTEGKSTIDPSLTENAVGWGTVHGADADEPILITVVDDPHADDSTEQEHYTPIEGWYPWVLQGCSGTRAAMLKSGNFLATLEDMVPHPEFTIHVDHGAAPEPPSAWEVELDFPKQRMEIHSVHLVRENPSAGIVTWNAEAPDLGTCGTSNGTLTIQVIDPVGPIYDSDTRVKVVFEVVNADISSACAVPIIASDLPIQSSQAYDEQGEAMAAAEFEVVLLN